MSHAMVLQTLSINNVDLPVLTYKGQRVITLDMMDTVHARKSGTARKNFNRNKHHLTEGKHYFEALRDEAEALGITAPNGLILLTEKGYTKLVKAFRDALAWDVQDALVDGYFRLQQSTLPAVYDERTAIAIQTLVRLDGAEHRIKLLEEENRRKDMQIARAETKADMALDEAHRFTIEAFVLKNGLLRQFPESTWPGAARWLRTFCTEYGLPTHKVPVVGKAWEDEWAYPLQALAAWVRHASRTRQQDGFRIEEDGIRAGETL